MLKPQKEELEIVDLTTFTEKNKLSADFIGRGAGSIRNY